LPWEVAVVLMGFEIHIGGRWWKMADKGSQVPVKYLIKNVKTHHRSEELTCFFLTASLLPLDDEAMV
jgi:hypothetical protein